MFQRPNADVGDWTPGVIKVIANSGGSIGFSTTTTGRTFNEIRAFGSVELNASNAKWSPDGKTILFNSHNQAKAGQNANLYTMSANGSHLRQITHYRGGLNAFADGWSPDGTEIVFHLRGTRRNGSNINQLVIMDMANRSLRQLTHMSDDMNPGFADWH